MSRFECGPWEKVGEDEEMGVTSPRFERKCSLNGFPYGRGMVWYMPGFTGSTRKSGWRSAIWHGPARRQMGFHCCHLLPKDAKLEVDVKLRAMRRRFAEERS